MAYDGHHYHGHYDYSRPPPPPPPSQHHHHYSNGHYMQPQQPPYEHSRYQHAPPPPPQRQQQDHAPYHNGSHLPPPPPQQRAAPPAREPLPPSPASPPKAGTDRGPLPISRSWQGFAFALKVGQQPDRARMCGFGDKDRRPISPPPCIQLIIVEEKTGEEIDYNKVEDLSRFILIVDLADVETLQESNLVHHLSNANPSIGSTERGTYPPTHVSSPNVPQAQDYDISRIRGYDYGGLANGNGYPPNGPGYSAAYGGPQPVGYGGIAPGPATPSWPQPTNPTTSGTCSRNLIGSLSATSFKLTDTDGKTGLWFIFQDLSIRTEGVFRLKFTFFDLMCHRPPIAPASGEPLANYSPLLASIYSQPFQVWSAKKFPGVRATTNLSQTFADQGIKIPVRKNEGKADGEKKRKRGNRDDDESGEDFDEEDE